MPRTKARPPRQPADLRAAGRARQRAQAVPDARAVLAHHRGSDGVGVQAAPGRQVPQRQRVRRRRRGLLVRARAPPTSDYKGYLTSVEIVTKVDAHTVRIKTKGPNPILVQNLTNLFMMDKEWSEANNAAKPQDFKNKEENFAVRNANGTGPFALVSREPDVKTVFKRNDGLLGPRRGPARDHRADAHPDQGRRDARRRAALGRGRFRAGRAGAGHRAPQELAQPRASPTGPENRTIFLGMDVGSPQLRSSDVKGKNPFADAAGAPGHEHGDQPRGDPARRHARASRCRPARSCRRSSTATPRSSTRCRASTSPRPRRCSPRPAIRTASRSACTARTTAISTTRRSARPRSACSARSASRRTWSRSRSRCTSR